jgi:LmbE family N-acetylglucosaminyl deacetylase
VSCDPTAWFFDNPGSVDDSGGEGVRSEFYNHSDHRTAGVVALDAAFPGAGNPHFFSDHIDEGLDPHDVLQVWLGWTKQPSHVEDITGHFETKIAALAEHASQLAEGIRFFEEFLEKDARRAGGRIGAELAEEFRVIDLS